MKKEPLWQTILAAISLSVVIATILLAMAI